MQFSATGLNLDELELELIDFGCEEFVVEEGVVYVSTGFNDFNNLQKALAQKGITIDSAEMQRIPLNTAELPEDKAKDVLDLIERLEDDEDVQLVYHSMK